MPADLDDLPLLQSRSEGERLDRSEALMVPRSRKDHRHQSAADKEDARARRNDRDKNQPEDRERDEHGRESEAAIHCHHRRESGEKTEKERRPP